MKLTCERRVLAEALGRVRGAVGAQSALHILGNILLEAELDRLRVCATDLELHMSCSVAATVEASGNITMPARLLGDVAAVLPDGQVDIRAGEGDAGTAATIRCGRVEYAIPTLPPEEFPPAPSVADEGGFSMDLAELLQIIRQVAFAASKEDTRPALTGVLLAVTPEGLTFAATDTHRLAEVKTTPTELHGEGRLIVPARALSEWRDALRGASAGPVEVIWDDNQILFESESLRLSSRRLSGPFPGYEKIMPENPARRLLLGRDELMQALRRVEVVGRSDSGRVRLRSEGARLELNAKALDLGSAHEGLEAQTQGKIAKAPFEIGLSARYLIDALASMDSADVSLELTEPLSPVLLRPEGQDRHRSLIMPMSLL